MSHTGFTRSEVCREAWDLTELEVDVVLCVLALDRDPELAGGWAECDAIADTIGAKRTTVRSMLPSLVRRGLLVVDRPNYGPWHRGGREALGYRASDRARRRFELPDTGVVLSDDELLRELRALLSEDTRQAA